MNIYSTVSYNSQKLGANQISFEEWINCCTSTPWNATQQQKGTNHWFKKPLGWISRELWWVAKSQSKGIPKSSLWFYSCNICEMTEMIVNRFVITRMWRRGVGLGRRVGLAIRGQHKGPLWWWRCSISDRINVSILVVILYYI